MRRQRLAPDGAAAAVHSRRASRPRIGIVGWGDIAAYHARHLSAAGADVTGAVTSRVLPEGVQRYPSLAAMLPDIDAVTIAVPNHLHASLCVEALRGDKPVFVEKPLCITSDELTQLEQAFRVSRVPVLMGFRLRWNPALVALRDRLTGVRAVRCTYRLGIDHLARDKPWTRDAATSGGAFMTLGVHALDVARWIARADGAALSDLRATARGDSGRDPLVVAMSGRLPGDVLIEAGADLRGDAAFRLDLAVDAAGGADQELLLPGLRPEDPAAPDVEYGPMMAAFVRASTIPSAWTDNRADILQCHRELLAARAIANA